MKPIIGITMDDPAGVGPEIVVKSLMDKSVYERFAPTHELANSVVRMNVEEDRCLHLTIKPGSYDFPKTIWDFSKLKNE